MQDAILITPHCDESESEIPVSYVTKAKTILDNIESTTEPKVTRNNVVLSDIEELAKYRDSSSDELHIESLYVSTNGPNRLLYESESMHVHKSEVALSLFRVETNNRTKFTVISVTVVFRGDFVGSNYTAGDISVQLKALDANGNDRALTCEVVDVQSNTKQQLGIVIMQIGTKDTTICDGLYEIRVTANESTTFSIALTGAFANAISAELEMALARIIWNERDAKLSSNLALEMEPRIRLLERKLQLEESLLHQARIKCDESEIHIEQLELQLDERDELPDKGASMLKRMRILEEEYKHWRLVLQGR